MPYTDVHLLLRINGHFGGDATTERESWTAGMRIYLATPEFTEAKKAAFLSTIQAAVSAFHTSTATSAGELCWLDRLTAAYIGLDGKYQGGANQPTTQWNYAPRVAGNGLTWVPWDVARAITLVANIERGRASKGRFYYPNAQVVDNDGRWTVSNCNSAASAAATMLNSINQAADAQWGTASGISVFSSLDQGTTGRVYRVEVGRAPDTQRRRTRNLEEGYSGVDLTSAAAVRQELANKSY